MLLREPHKLFMSAGHQRFLLLLSVCFLFPFFYSCGNPIMVNLLSPFRKTNALVPDIIVQPVSASYDFGDSAAPLTVSATADDGGTLSYQWYKNGVPIPGETSGTCAPATDSLGNCSFHVVVTNTIADNGDRGNKSATAVSNAAIINTSLRSINSIRLYLSSVSHGSVPADPAPLPVSIGLGDTTEPESVWIDLLGVLDEAGVFVDLDLSACSISGTGFGSTYAGSGGKDGIVSIVLPSGITSISDGAFGDCTNLVGIRPLDGLISIGEAAFSGCAKLARIDLFGSLNSIGAYAFADCGSLNRIAMPDGITSVDAGTFSGCGSLATVIFPAVTSIGNSAFASCESLSAITLGKADCDISTGGQSERFKDFIGFYIVSPQNAAAGTYTWNAGAWTGPH